MSGMLENLCERVDTLERVVRMLCGHVGHTYEDVYSWESCGNTSRHQNKNGALPPECKQACTTCKTFKCEEDE